MPAWAHVIFSFVRGCSGPLALQRQNQITFCLDSNDSCLWGSPGLGLQKIGEEIFSADLQADATSLCLSVGGVLRDAGENAGEHPQSGEAKPWVGGGVGLLQ